jgi:hypothetical protein
MSEDPKLFDAGDYNLFRYCHNDPVDFTDPMGLFSGRDFIIDSWSYSLEALGAIAGFTAGGGGSALASGGVLAPAGAVAGAGLGAAGGYATGRYIGTKLADLVTHKQGANNSQGSKGKQDHQAATNVNRPTPSSSSAAKTGATVFRQGTFANEATGWEGNYVKGRHWATDNPVTTPNYAQRYGLPAENTSKPDWIVGARVQGPYTTRPAPQSFNNPLNTGGATEVVPRNPNNVRLDWFHMPD